MQEIKHIIWDFDGTLVDTYPVMAMSLLKAAGEFGIDTDYEAVYKQLKDSLSDAVEYFSGGDETLRKSLRKRFSELEQEADPDAYSLFPDTLQTLQRLKANGISHYVLTHRNASTMRIMAVKNMADLIVDVVISDDGFKRKPDPEAFNHLIEKHGLNRQQTLSVGDRLFDVEAGKNAGIQGCLIADTYNVPFLDKADYTVETRLEIADLILSGRESE